MLLFVKIIRQIKDAGCEIHRYTGDIHFINTREMFDIEKIAILIKDGIVVIPYMQQTIYTPVRRQDHVSALTK